MKIRRKLIFNAFFMTENVTFLIIKSLSFYRFLRGLYVLLFPVCDRHSTYLCLKMFYV